MRSLPTHRNRFTGELLANAVQVCHGCELNFASTRAGDKHRDWSSGKGVCRLPSECGLEKTINKHGSVIYRVPKKVTKTPTPFPLLAPDSTPEGYRLTA
jgi:hypothetical protein